MKYIFYLKYYFKVYWNKTICLISDFYYRSDDSSMLKHWQKYNPNEKPSIRKIWSLNSRNPICGIFGKYLF